MANYANLLATIAANIYTNHNNEVTASMVKAAVDAMVGSLGDGYQFAGVATPSSPGTAQTPDEKVFYIATEPGTYAYLGNLDVPDGISILYWDSTWQLSTIKEIDDTPISGSENLVKSGGVFDLTGGEFFNGQTTEDAWVGMKLYAGRVYKIEISNIVKSGVDDVGFTFWTDTYADGGVRVESQLLSGIVFTSGGTTPTKLEEGTYYFIVTSDANFIRTTDGTAEIAVSGISEAQQEIEGLRHSINKAVGVQEIFDPYTIRKGYGVYVNGADYEIRPDNDMAITTHIVMAADAKRVKYSGIIASAAVRALFTDGTDLTSTGIGLIMPDPSDGEFELTAAMKQYQYMVLTIYRGNSGDPGDIDVSNVSVQFIYENSIEDIYEKITSGGLEYDISKLYGKTINFIGDSYVHNNGDGIPDTWHYKVAALCNMTYNNYGIDGDGLVAVHNGLTPVKDRYNVMGDADYVVVIGGKNDYNEQISIADFKTGLRTLCSGLVEKYLGKKICFFTPWTIPQSTLDDVGNPATLGITLLEYIAAIVDVCAEYSIPVFDTKYSGLFMGVSANWRTLYMQGPNDVSHLNPDGHDLFINKGFSFLKSL